MVASVSMTTVLYKIWSNWGQSYTKNYKVYLHQIDRVCICIKLIGHMVYVINKNLLEYFEGIFFWNKITFGTEKNKNGQLCKLKKAYCNEIIWILWLASQKTSLPPWCMVCKKAISQNIGLKTQKWIALQFLL